MTAAVVAATVLVRTDPAPDGPVGLLYAGDAGGARDLLLAIAGTTVALTGTVFSLTVVALQIASAQFSPRLVRNVLRDRATQLTLSAFLATAAFNLATLRAFPADRPDPPRVAVTVALALGFASVGVLVYFIHHLAHAIRVESLLRGAVRLGLEVIDEVFPPGRGRSDLVLPVPPPGAAEVAAQRSGYVQAIYPDVALDAVAAADLVCRYRAQVGVQVVAGAPLAWVWRRRGSARGEGVAPDELARVAELVEAAVDVGFERTAQQDVAFALRQVVDVAVKAVSPAINDPTTAVDAVGHLAALLGRLLERGPAPQVRLDEQGVPRVGVPRPSFAEHLELAVGQPRRYAAAEPTVVAALLRMLTDLAAIAVDDHDREVIRAQADALAAEALERTTSALDRERVAQDHAAFCAAFRGEPVPDPPRAW